MAANSRHIPEKRMHWLSRSTTIHGDSFNNSTISEDSGRGMSGRFDIRQRIAHLYRKQLYTDVMFVIQCGIEPKPVFYAHKAILAAGSKHFAEMLFGSEDNLPKTTEPVKKLQINNVSPEAFRNVIEFLYTDDMYFDNEPLVIETLLTAKKFEIQPLIDRCESHLEEIELCNSTVCSLLQIATEHKIDALKNRCLSFIQENTGDVIKAEDFMKSPLSTVRTICKLQSLNLASEIELITAAFKWAEHQNTSSKRAAVEPVLRCLRFLILEAKDFSNLLNQYPDIFTSHEALQIMMYLSNPGKGIDKLPSWCNKGTNRCSYVKPPVPSVSPVDTKIPPGQKKLEIALKPFSPQNFLSSLNCNLEIRCNCGRFQLIGLTLLFQEPIMKRSHIDTLTITVVVKPTNFRYKEILKITDSKEVQFTFQKGILFSQGQVASIQAEAENAEFYYFLQFDEKHLPQVDPRFTCSLGSSAKESKLFFIYEVFYVELPFRRPPSRRSNR